MSLVSVIILNFNGKKYLEEFLPSVVSCSSRFEIVVADNCSTDASVSFVKEKFPSVRLFELDKNYGFCGGYNRAIAGIQSKYTILLNSDIEVTEKWIEPLLDAMERDEGIAAVQPKILAYHQRECFEYAGAAGGFIDKYGYPFCRGRIFDTIEKDEGQYDDFREVFWATGACMMVRTELFLKSGGFDEYFFAHMEEIDLCWRLKNAGYKIACCPTSVVYHVGGGTLPKDNPRKVFLNFRNSLFVLVKNLPARQVFSKVFIRLLLDFPAALMYLFKGSFSCFWSVFLAHMDFYSKLSLFLKKREERIKKPQTLSGYYTSGIVFKYYLSRAGKFTDLGI